MLAVEESCPFNLISASLSERLLTEAPLAPLYLGAKSTFYDDYLCFVTMSFVPNAAKLSSQVT